MCTFAFAHTINWHVDGNTYQTTTCNIGNDVILPNTPTKRGYTFKGWEEEHFLRGQFETWTDVPTTDLRYLRDIYNNRVPAHSDYIIVEDASDYVPLTFNDSFEFWNVSHNYQTIWAHRYNDTTVQKSVVYTSGNALKPEENWWDYFGPNNEILIKRINGNIIVIAQTTLRFNGQAYTSGQTILSTNLNDSSNDHNTHVVEFLSGTYQTIEGRWKFIYSGTWDTDGKIGWIPDQQISNTLE